MSGVTIIVPNWNGSAVLDDLLRSLLAQTHPIAEILVIDNGSTDGSAEAATERGARVVRLGGNFGFAAAVNRGIAEAGSEYVAVVNNDVETAPDWLAQLVGALGDEAAWFAAGKILQWADRTRLDGAYDAISRAGCAWRVGNGRPDSPEFSVRRRIFFAPGTATLFRRALFERIGGFDEGFESYLEDVDLGLRCALAGFGGWYVPGAVAWHRGSATLGKWHPRTVRLISRNQWLLVAKHYPKRLMLRFAWPIFVGQCLWGVVAWRHGGGWAWVLGKFEGVARAVTGTPGSNRIMRRASGSGLESESGSGGTRADLGVRPTTIESCATSSLRGVLEVSEGEIMLAQSRCGFDSYWRWYFRLCGGRAARG